MCSLNRCIKSLYLLFWGMPFEKFFSPLTCLVSCWLPCFCCCLPTCTQSSFLCFCFVLGCFVSFECVSGYSIGNRWVHKPSRFSIQHKPDLRANGWRSVVRPAVNLWGGKKKRVCQTLSRISYKTFFIGVHSFLLICSLCFVHTQASSVRLLSEWPLPS